jgi:ArsR family transcriptional regulator, virulence genes transcriptional regulator
MFEQVLRGKDFQRENFNARRRLRVAYARRQFPLGISQPDGSIGQYGRLGMTQEDNDLINAQAALLAAMANANRLKILLALVDGETTVGDLSQHVDLSQSALSQHLSKLRHERLVKTRRDAQNIYYSTSDPRVVKMLSALREIFKRS